MGNRKNGTLRVGGDDLPDSTDADSVASSSIAISATEHVNLQESMLNEYISALYERKASKRVDVLTKLVDTFERVILHVENTYATLLSQVNDSVKKGSTNESCLASRAIGLLAITVGCDCNSYFIMEKSHPHISRALQSRSDVRKMIAALDCLAVITFVGARDLAETELSLKAMWNVIHTKNSKGGTVLKAEPSLLAAARCGWTLLVTTIGFWSKDADSWKEPIAFICTLLEAKDCTVRMAAGEALAVCFELNLLGVSSFKDADGTASGEKEKPFLNMQALKAKIERLASNVSAETVGQVSGTSVRQEKSC